MMTLTYLSTTLTLPSDLIWRDEYDWHPVVQSVEYSTTGAMIVDAMTKQAGRPITLMAGENFAWMQRSTVAQLKTWAAIAGAEFVLSLNGTSFNVIFDHTQTAFEASPVVEFSAPLDSDYYVLTLRFLEI